MNFIVFCECFSNAFKFEVYVKDLYIYLDESLNLLKIASWAKVSLIQVLSLHILL